MNGNADQRFDRIEETLEHHGQTLDRLLTLALDHAKDMGILREDQKELRADVREIRRAVTGVQEGFREHLTWHLGHQ